MENTHNENFEYCDPKNPTLKPYIKNELIEGIVGKEEIKLLDKAGVLDKSNLVFISIHDPDDSVFPEEITNGFKDVLQIQFWDIEEGIGRIQPITNEQGKTIKDFILKNKGNRFLINCKAGMSRSAAVGCAVECLVEFDGDVYGYKTSPSGVRNHPRYFPNLKVFDTILNS